MPEPADECAVNPDVTAHLVLLGKIALVVFIIGGVGAVVIRAILVSRANKTDPDWITSRRQHGDEASVYGVMPRVPLPEWVHWETEISDDGGDK